LAKALFVGLLDALRRRGLHQIAVALERALVADGSLSVAL
jgi:hypothetical protein